MRPESKRRGLFLDRDGVLNRNVLYADTGVYESPRTAAELVLSDGVGSALLRLQSADFLLFLVSNQPNAVKRKCTLQDLQAIDASLQAALSADGIQVAATYYCYHHPDHGGSCPCRKPQTYFLETAAAAFHIDLRASWMIGDRASDIECGNRAGTSTIWIDNSEGVAPPAAADLVVHSLAEVADHLCAGL